MLLKVTEYCAWEQEKWSYIIDMDKQEAAAINWLMIFIRCANKYFEQVKEDPKRPRISYSPIFDSHRVSPFAASRYSYEFYDGIDEKGTRTTLIKSDGNLSLSKGGGYHNFTNIITDRKISRAKMKSAAIAIRDKNENKLYKSFDSIFLTKKLKEV